MKKLFIMLCFIVVLALLVKPFLYWQNETVGITKYTVQNSKIPKAFDNYKIILLADIQGEQLILENKVIGKIRRINADMLILCGDLVDEGVENSNDILIQFLQNCNFPKELYAVSGNHDLWTGRFEELKEQWESMVDLTFLENQKITITKDGESINLFGISDPNVWNDEKAKDIVDHSIKSLNATDNAYNILLFHRANMLDMFNEEKFDLVLSGHMHGGQVRIPFIGGLISPHGDWFPKYSGGRYNINNHTYIVTRGIGNAVSVPRVFNRPEIVVITLKK